LSTAAQKVVGSPSPPAAAAAVEVGEGGAGVVSGVEGGVVVGAAPFAGWDAGGDPVAGLPVAPRFTGIVVVGTGAEVPPTVGADVGAPGLRPGIVVVGPGGLTVPAALFTEVVVGAAAEPFEPPPRLHAVTAKATSTAAPMPRRVAPMLSPRQPVAGPPPAP
jgi:hypothetical protein